MMPAMVSRANNPPITASDIQALVSAVEGLKPHDSFFGPEFFASILGAIVGGLIAAAIQFWSYREQRAERARAEKQRQAANAFSILTKINRAYTTINTVKRQTDKAALECVRRGMRLSAAFEAFSGDVPRFDLTADEVEFLRTTKKAALISQTLDLPHIHNMYADTLGLLREHKLSISELQDSTVIRPDGSGTSVFKGNNAFKAQIAQFQADKLVGALLGYSLRDEPRTRALLKGAQEAFIDVVGKEHIGVVWSLDPKADQATSKKSVVPVS